MDFFNLKIAGVLLLLLALLNFALPKELGWKKDLAKLSLINRQIFWVHAFFIVLILVMMGVLSLFFTAALLTPSPLSRLVLGGLAAFWLIRLFVQWFGYDRSLWRGNMRNTLIHIAFTALWLYFAGAFGVNCWRQFQ